MVLTRPVLIQGQPRTPMVRAETERSLSPPPPPDSTFQPEPGELEIYCTELEWIPPPTPPGEEATTSDEKSDIMSPSTIFKQSYNGDRQSPWGPPTRSMTKKKGWVEPEKPNSAKFSKPEMKRVADSNELLEVFERRSNGGRISNRCDEAAPRDEPTVTAFRKDDEIGGNIHVRISYTIPSTLHISVKQADDILIKSRRKTCNPYAMVTLLGDYEVFKTKVNLGTDRPNWNETFDFALPLKFLQSTAVLIVVYSEEEDLGSLHGTFLGETHISLSSYKHFKVLDDWYPLEDLRREEDKFDGYKELQKVLTGMKNRAPQKLPDTLRQDELRQEEAYSSY